MYSKNYMGEKPENISVPPEYGGTSVGMPFPAPPPEEPCDPHLPPPSPPIPRKGLLDFIPSEDLILFGAAALILSRSENDLLSVGLLIMLVLL